MAVSETSNGNSTLAVRSVSKTYSATRALRDVSFDVTKGTLHALVGGNGSGKSTLVKILAGVVHSDPGGTVSVSGNVVDANKISPETARAAGLHFVHQDPAVFGDMTVADNLFFGTGFPTGRIGNISGRRQRREAAEILSRFSLDVAPTDLIAGLSSGRRTMVAIARALKDQAELHSGILVLDEPTASLPEAEAHGLLAMLRRFASAGQTVLYITHRLDEILGVADEVTVLRDGRHIVTRTGEGLSESELIRHIVGRPLTDIFPPARESAFKDVVLRLDGLSVGPLSEVSLDVHSGEVVGVAGLLGSGRSSLLRSIFGAQQPSGGTIHVDGKAVPAGRPVQAMQFGIGYVPEDRANEANFADQSVEENLLAASTPEFFRRGRLNTGREHDEAHRLVESMGVKTGSIDQPISSLSGGNQQKVIFGRWLRRRPRVLLLDEPTQGVDVGARADIYRLIRNAVDFGAAVLVVSSDLEELAGLCDRVVILRRGVLAEQVRAPNIEATRLTELTYSGETAL